MIWKIIKNGWIWAIVLASVIVYSFANNKKLELFTHNSPTGDYVLCANNIKVPQEVESLQESFRNVADVAKQAVVSVSTVHVENYEYYSPYEYFFGDPFEEYFNNPQDRNQQRGQKQQPKQLQRKFEGMGSGVIIDSKGLILTNEHVVRDADEIKIHLVGREKPLLAEVIGKDARTDLAVIKIKENGVYPSLTMADSNKIKVGDWAIAIGSPFGLEQTVTVGIISAVRQSLSIEGQNYRDLIQTDAAINRGNSGGPLLNIKGEVMGINTAIYAPTGVFSGIGFAIPSNRAKDILDDLIHKGKVVRGWLGVEIKSVDEIIARQFGLKEPSGALVNDVFGNSPADKAGIKRGDIILEFDGKAVKDVQGLQDLVSATPPKKKTAVSLLRKKQRISVTLITGEMPSETEVAKTNEKKETDISQEWLGMKTQNINPLIAKRYNLSENKGVVVVSVEESKEAAQAGIQQGDVIISINQIDIQNIEAYNKIIKTIDISKGVIFDIIREGKPLYISFMLEK